MPECGKIQRTTSAFKEHTRNVHKTLNVATPTTCSACGRSFPSFQSGSSHYVRCKAKERGSNSPAMPTASSSGSPTFAASSPRSIQPKDDLRLSQIELTPLPEEDEPPSSQLILCPVEAAIPTDEPETSQKPPPTRLSRNRRRTPCQTNRPASPSPVASPIPTTPFRLFVDDSVATPVDPSANERPPPTTVQVADLQNEPSQSSLAHTSPMMI